MTACQHVAGVRCSICAPPPYTLGFGHAAPHTNAVWVQPAVSAPFRCPVCDGRGTVAEDFYTDEMAGFARTSCRACWKTGLVWRAGTAGYSTTAGYSGPTNLPAPGT